MEGTYRLPEAQLDRFLMRLRVGYPDLATEVMVIMSDCAGVNPDALSPVVDIPTLREAVARVRSARIDPAIVEYAASLTAATRRHVDLRYGASPRGSIALVRAAQAVAATYGRGYVIPDDIKEVAHPVLEHRLILTSDAELNQRRPEGVVNQILAEIPAPVMSAAGGLTVRLTRRGVGVLGTATVLFGLDYLAGYPLLLALAAIATGAVLAALAVTARRPRVTVVRELYTDRVERGRPVVVTLRVRNPGTRRQAGFTAVDRIGSGTLTVLVRSLAPGAEARYQNDIVIDRRGRHHAGPLTLTRTDALGLGRSQLSIGDTSTFLVYPRIHPVRAIAAGRPRHHHEGTATDRSLRGSLDLREVREYVVGDEVRHLHWKATARTGTLMIRDYADPNQPRFTVVLDNRPTVPDPMFEESVELAASLLTAAAKADHRCRLLTSAGLDVPTAGGALAVRRLLDELAILTRAADPDLPLVPTPPPQRWHPRGDHLHHHPTRPRRPGSREVGPDRDRPLHPRPPTSPAPKSCPQPTRPTPPDAGTR